MKKVLASCFVVAVVIVSLISISNATSTSGMERGLEIKAGGVAASHLASDAVTSAKILNGSIETAKLATDSVTNAKVLKGSIDSTKLLAVAVGTAAGKLVCFRATGVLGYCSSITDTVTAACTCN